MLGIFYYTAHIILYTIYDYIHGPSLRSLQHLTPVSMYVLHSARWYHHLHSFPNMHPSHLPHPFKLHAPCTP